MTPAAFAEYMLEGVLMGDIIEEPNIPQLIGAIGGSIIPYVGTVADLRDAGANAAYGNWGMAVLSTLGAVPVYGDVAKGSGKAVKFIANNIDKLDEISQLLEGLAHYTPDILKQIPINQWDDIVELIKTGKGISKHQYNKLSKVLASVGQTMPENIPFKSFDALKNFLGSPGKGNDWHHIVEQSQIKKSKLPVGIINCKDNVIALDKATHRMITNYYHAIDPDISGTMRVRDWLIGKSSNYQFEFGKGILKKFGVLYE
jgi:hypothetical protein